MNELDYFKKPQLLKQGGQEDKGENAKLQCYIGSVALGDMMRTSFGPRGMDKILIPLKNEGDVKLKTSVTNDGATILKNILIDNPAAKILIDLSKKQDQECGDGTTGVVILAAELLRNSQTLIEKSFHPQTIIQGYRIAYDSAIKKLNQSFFDTKPENLFQILTKLAKTSLSSKILGPESDHFADIAVKAVLRLKNKSNTKLINIIKLPGGSYKDSHLEDGILLQKEIARGFPKKIINPKVLVANTPMDFDKVKIFGGKVGANDYMKILEIQQAEKQKMISKVDAISKYQPTVFVNRQLIYDYPKQLLKQKNICTIEHADFSGIEYVAAALGAEIVSTFNDPDPNVLGECGLIEEILIAEKKFVRFSNCKKRESCTILLRGPNEHFLDEAERALHDSISIVSQTINDTRVVLGGGCIEMAMAVAIDETSKTVSNKKQIATKAFSDALKTIPYIIAENGGYDASEISAQLNSVHSNDDKCEMGIDIENGCLGNMREKGILESYRSKYYQLTSAMEVAEQIIRVDAIITCPQRKSQ